MTRAIGWLLLLLFLGPAALAADTGPENIPPDPAAQLDPIAMAVTEVERGHAPILRRLTSLDIAIVPALEKSYLRLLTMDEDDAMLMVRKLGDDDYDTRELATLTLIGAKADINAALGKSQESSQDPEVSMRLDRILSERKLPGKATPSIIPEALFDVYNNWFDTLFEERATRLLNDPWDRPACVFFTLAPSSKVAAALAKRPALEQAKLWLANVHLPTNNEIALRALGQIDRAVLIQAARETWWPLELPSRQSSGELVLYESIEGNVIYNALFIPLAKDAHSIFPTGQAFCVFQMPPGTGNAALHVGAMLRSRSDCRLDLGRLQPFTVRHWLDSVPPGMLLPRFPFVDGMMEDWEKDVNRIPLWSKPFMPSDALKPSMKFVLNAGNEIPDPDPADKNMLPGFTSAATKRNLAGWLQAAAAGNANATPTAARTPAELQSDWQAFNNASAAQLPQVLTVLARRKQQEFTGAIELLAASNRQNAGGAALEALHALDPVRAGRLSLRLVRVKWAEERGEYAFDFLKRHYARAKEELDWKPEERTAIPAGIAERAATGKGN